VTVSRELAQRAARLGGVAHLTAVRLRRCTFELLDPSPEGPFSADVGLRLHWHGDGAMAVYFLDVEVDGTAVGGELFLRSEVSFVIAYELPGDQEFEDGDFEAFGNITAAFTGFPYVRELIHSLTARAGIAGLQLDVLRFPLEAVAIDDADGSP
jgi:hypothetical protein